MAHDTVSLLSQRPGVMHVGHTATSTQRYRHVKSAGAMMRRARHTLFDQAIVTANRVTHVQVIAPSIHDGTIWVIHPAAVQRCYMENRALRVSSRASPHAEWLPLDRRSARLLASAHGPVHVTFVMSRCTTMVANRAWTSPGKPKRGNRFWVVVLHARCLVILRCAGCADACDGRCNNAVVGCCWFSNFLVHTVLSCHALGASSTTHHVQCPHQVALTWLGPCQDLGEACCRSTSGVFLCVCAEALVCVYAAERCTMKSQPTHPLHSHGEHGCPKS